MIEAQTLAAELADGPTFANAMTKRMLEMEWAMSVESAIEAEAVAQALCMQTEDFSRAYHARQQAEAGLRGQLRWAALPLGLDILGDTLDWPFFGRAIALSPRNCPAGPIPSR